MNIAQSIQWKYPQASPVDDFHVVDNLDGQGAKLVYWNVKDEQGNVLPEPTEDELSVWWIFALQETKINEMNDVCNKSILEGFNSSCLGVEHQYQFGYDDQINLSGQLNLFNADETTTECNWKTIDAGVLVHTKAQFIQLFKDGLAFKAGQIGKYWTLKAQILSAKTEDEINAIVW
jgi:hypothetical protein